MRNEFLRLLGFALLPVLIFSILTVSVIGRKMADKSVSDDAAHMKNVQTEIDMIIKDLDALNLSFSVNSEITSVFARFFQLNDVQAMGSLKNICKSYLIPVVVSHEHIHSIYFYTENSRNICLTSSFGPVQTTDFIDTGWMQAYDTMMAQHLDSYYEVRSFKDYAFEEEPKEMITLYRRLFRRNGVIVLNLYKKYFDGMLAAQSTGNAQMLLCIGDRNQVLMQSTKKLPLTEEQLSELRTRESFKSGPLRLNNTDYLVTGFPAGNRYEWAYLSLTPLSDVYDFTRSLVETFFLILLPTLAICLLVAWRHALSYKRNVMRIFRMLDAVERHDANIPQFIESGHDFYSIIMQRTVWNYAERAQLHDALEQKQRRMHEIELHALRSQINPHFLMNTLRSVYWMSFSLSGGPNSVSTMIENMTAVLEYSLDSSEDLASLGDEIRNTRSYVEIQKVRYQDRFDLVWDLEEGIEQYCTIKLLIQPLLENAIMHGMRNTGEKLEVSISIRKAEDEIRMIVSDNGCGIPEEELEKINSRLNAHTIDGHVGLYNCNKRLCLTFGEEYHIRVQSEETGTNVSIHFPCLTYAEEAHR